MNRIPLFERVLPAYTKPEERMNMITHIIGAALGLFVLILGLLIAARHRNPWAVVSCCIYGISMILLYTMSSVYHGIPISYGKKVMQVIDHCTIFALIAGTYTPVLLVSIRPLHPLLAWVIFSCEWGFAILGAALNAVDLKKYSIFSMICYIFMGWFIILAIKPTVEAVSFSGFFWMLSGGIAYTIGAVLYGKGKGRRYFHSVFHVFVVIGTALQAVCILKYVL